MRDLWSRRQVNKAALALLGSTAFALPASAATTLRVGKAVGESIAFTPVDIGMKRGIFPKLGLTLQISGFSGGPKMQQALAAGSLDIGLGSGPDLVGLLRGEQAKAVATIVDAPAYLVLLARPGINSLADLKGKVVNVASLGSITGWLGNKIWQSQHWTKDDVKFTIGPPAAGLALMKTHQSDAMITDGTFALRAQEQGVGKIIYNFGDLVRTFHTHMIFASDALIAKNPDAVKAFIVGWFQTVKAMQDDKAQTVKDLQDILGLDAKVAEESYDQFMPMFKTNGHFSAQALAVLARSLVDMKLLPTEPKNLGQFCTEDFLPKS
jgi:ABC-type nitrate/sulfonate/bicarbonate transport system substrate-binding protein